MPLIIELHKSDDEIRLDEVFLNVIKPQTKEL